MRIQYSTSQGIQYSLATIVGNQLGANNVKLLKRYLKVTAFITAVIVIVSVLSAVAFRRSLVSLFTTDEEIISKTCSILLIVESYFVLVNC